MCYQTREHALKLYEALYQKSSASKYMDCFNVAAGVVPKSSAEEDQKEDIFVSGCENRVPVGT
ncbi:MAG: hypothetical protein P4M11_06665 [Candidatus Pacebacteria bacterium]|nr:hypothetical protein [Candidatus Paceibacterota bacterium]